MRFATLLVLALLLAGCTGSGKPPATSSGPGWHADCSLGSYVGSLWPQDCVARASHTAGSKAEMWIAVNPKDPRNVVVAAKDLNPEISNRCVWNGIFVTHDAGVTWTDVNIGGRYADRRPDEPWYGYACNTDPMFRFTDDGALHYGVELYNFGGRDAYGVFGGTPLQGDEAEKTPGWKILLATSTDGGLTFPTVITYAPDTGPLVDDYSRMTINPKTQSIIEAIVLATPEFNECNILVSRDGGKTAATPMQIMGPTASETGGLSCSVVAGGPDGTVVVGAEGGGTSRWTRSTDDARTFGPVTTGFTFKAVPGRFKESQYRAGTNFEIAYDLTTGPRSGTLYVAYSDASRDEADVYVRASKDNGVTWSEPTMVNQDAQGTHQWLPNIAVAGDGSLHVVYMDKQFDPEHRLIDISHAVSLDGGATWTNERVTNASWDGDLGIHQRGFPFIGDYLGIAAVGDEVWAGFPDASLGGVPVAAASHFHRTTG